MDRNVELGSRGPAVPRLHPAKEEGARAHINRVLRVYSFTIKSIDRLLLLIKQCQSGGSGGDGEHADSFFDIVSLACSSSPSFLHLTRTLPRLSTT